MANKVVSVFKRVKTPKGLRFYLVIQVAQATDELVTLADYGNRSRYQESLNWCKGGSV